MSWHGHLSLQYRRDADRSVGHDRHSGPLRVLAALYPEGPDVCHHVLVHPPGGLVGGDELQVEVALAPGSRALITTPGANRYYRSAGAPARQHVRLRLGESTRLEWLPLESIVFSGARADSRLVFELAPTAELIGWDLMALGLPTAAAPFVDGYIQQHIEWPGRWLEQGTVDAGDTPLLDSPLGFGGRRVLGLAWIAHGSGWSREALEALLEDTRHALASTAATGLSAGATSPQEGLLVVRVLGSRVEPVFAQLRQVHATWRAAAWQLPAHAPRVWRT